MSVNYEAFAEEEEKEPSVGEKDYVLAVLRAVRQDDQLRAWLESKILGFAPDKKLSGVFYRRKDGVEFPFSNPCYVIELDEKGMPIGLSLYKDGFPNEVYGLNNQNRAVYLAAVSQGFEPPRGLLRRDRPAR